ncbi:MAG: hypothetical protein ACLFV2_10395, partial [Desulfurivibrionaceae bacterium]
MMITIIRFTLFTMTLPIAVILLVPGLSSGAVNASEQEGLGQQRDKIERSIQDHQEKLKKSGEREENLLEQLKKIDRQLLRESSKYANLQQQIQKQENLIQKKQQEFEKLEKEKENLKLHIQKRLTAYYQMGDIGIINAIFSNSSVPELLNFRIMYKKMLSHDRQSFMDYN